MANDAVSLITRGTVNNAFSGVVNITTGVITTYPLADEAYPGGDRTFDAGGDGYKTSRFPRGLRYDDERGYPTVEDTPARPLAPGERRARTLSEPSPPRQVTPIRHTDPQWQGQVSHDQLARRTGGIPKREFEGRRLKRGEDEHPRFVGFTVWKEPRNLRLVCTSRSLNDEKFGLGGGRMSIPWADRIRDAFAAIDWPIPRAADDDSLPELRPNQGNTTPGAAADPPPAEDGNA
ncbi:MAG: hypothetical protein PW843_06615 [Azospirillaceae bacterium]|nr:hypothetical protein [Azospirillaceae bacterium]